MLIRLYVQAQFGRTLLEKLRVGYQADMAGQGLLGKHDTQVRAYSGRFTRRDSESWERVLQSGGPTY